MYCFSLKKNLVFKWSGADYRIDRLQPDGKILIECMETAQHSIVDSKVLLSDYSEGKISVERYPFTKPPVVPSYSRPLSELSEDIRTQVTKRQQYVDAALGAHDRPLSNTQLGRVISEVAAELNDPKPPSAITLYRWCRRYLAHRDTRVLIPRHDRRGRRTSIHGKVLDLLLEATEEAFAVSPQTTGTTIYTRLRMKIDELNRRAPALTPIRVPSERAVYRHLERLDGYQKAYLREGKRLANSRFRLVKASISVADILERVEMDHTPLDLFLIDERFKVPLGRPTLTVLIDHFSRMPLGYYLWFGHPSVVAVMGALRHAILPKRLQTTAIPSLPIHHEWPCYGLASVLVLDNGLEFHSAALDSIAFDLGIRLQFCPKKQPQFKGVIERYLKTINYSFVSQLPGASYPRLHQRGDYDPQKHAVLTLGEFTQLFEKWIVDVYAQTQHRGIRSTPWEKWHDGLQRKPLSLPANLDTLKTRIGIEAKPTLRKDGIVINGIQYRSDALSPLLMAYSPGIRLKAMVDPTDLGHVLVWGPEEQDSVSVPAVHQDYASGLTYAQHKVIRQHLRAEGRDPRNLAELDQAKIEIAQSVDQLLRSRKQSHRRKAALVRDITAERPQQELQLPKPLKPRPVNRSKAFTDATVDRMPTPSYTAFNVRNDKE